MIMANLKRIIQVFGVVLVMIPAIVWTQSSFWTMVQDIDRYIPFIGSCDRIVYAGVTNCMANFRPTQIGSKGSCCSYRKYRACIAGLKDGHSFAVARDRCPSHSISMPVIWAVSDRLVGLPLSSCGKDSCRSSSSSTSSKRRKPARQG